MLISKLEAALKCRSCKKRPIRPTCPHDQTNKRARDYALRLGASSWWWSEVTNRHQLQTWRQALTWTN